jgi:hypothetical protein
VFLSGLYLRYSGQQLRFRAFLYSQKWLGSLGSYFEENYASFSRLETGCEVPVNDDLPSRNAPLDD